MTKPTSTPETVTMNTRTYIAAAALQGILANSGNTLMDRLADVSTAVAYADALIAELSKPIEDNYHAQEANAKPEDSQTNR